jgi:hypothetical protein
VPTKQLLEDGFLLDIVFSLNFLKNLCLGHKNKKALFRGQMTQDLSCQKQKDM